MGSYWSSWDQQSSQGMWANPAKVCKEWPERFYSPGNFKLGDWISALTFKTVLVLNVHLGSSSMIHLKGSNGLVKHMWCIAKCCLPPFAICITFCMLSKCTLKRLAEGCIFPMGVCEGIKWKHQSALFKETTTKTKKSRWSNWTEVTILILHDSLLLV